ncbi:MAG: radical SAM protein [Planctomycetes bacterium]|nr:radical SAM protein [Planctomycetota bacterium]
MSALLINPPRRLRAGNIWKTIDRSLPPLGLGYIASYLEKHGVSVDVLDLQAQSYTLEDVIAFARRRRPEVVGITATSVEVAGALYIAERIKSRMPDVKVVLGGSHASVMPEDVLQHAFVDVVVRGEGEEAMREIASGMPLDTIRGISYHANGEIYHSPNRELVKDLDSLPFPAYHLLPMRAYRPSSGNYRRLPAMSMITTRGCPGKCTFCHTEMFGHRTRFRSPRSIADEIKLLVRDYGIREISFYDDTFTARRRNVAELCDILLCEKIGVTWSCMSRVDCVDAELLGAMKRAGCHQVGYGIESADEGILSNVNKKIDLNEAAAAVKCTRDAGMDARVMFMLGNPGETAETMEKTVRFALSLDADIFVFNITTPYPGTAMFQWARENGYLKTMDWAEYDLSKPVMELPTVSSGLVEEYYRRAYRRCYLRPRYLASRLLGIRSYEMLRMNVQTFWSMLRN